MKTCRGCLRELPLDSFGKNRAMADGVYYRCKECRLAYDKQWREANRDKDRAASARWRADHPELARERILRWRANNDRTPHDLRYREQHPEQVRAASRLRMHRRRAQLAGVFVEDVDIFALFERDAGVCGICRQEVEWDTASVDHIIPISKQGEHSYANVQLAHIRCNRLKWTR